MTISLLAPQPDANVPGSATSRPLILPSESGVAFVGGRPAGRWGRSKAPSPLAELVHDQFRALVEHARFSCLGAKAAIRTGQYWMGLYDALGSPEATDALADDLAAFAATSPPERGFSTFVASFAGPTPANELEFERLLWAQLQQLHDGDRSERWDSSVSSNPDDAHFSFSLAGRAFFVVGLHAASSRWARRFAWPTLVFNPHDQFNRLRAEGVFDRFRERIRDREHTLQGTLNPNLSDFGERSEARQYSGRPAEDDWRCPFRPKQSGRS